MMSTVAEIESAIKKLKPEDVWRVGNWLDELREELWDRQIDADVKAGRLDKLADKAMEDYRAGRCTPLDEILNNE
jgi:hypothetical protein